MIIDDGGDMASAGGEPRARHTALVLGGGGSFGNAWEIGIAAGLADGGVDIADADLVVGTSAGATTAAQLLGTHAADLYRSALAAVPPPAPSARPPRAAPPAVNHLERTAAIIAASKGAEDMRRQMGTAAIALAEASDPSRQAHWRAVVGSRLASTDWPRHRLLVTAVDATSGAGVAFDSDTGVDLVDALAATTSSGPAYAIGDRWFIDGGYRRGENADLARGYAQVLVLSPYGGRSRHPAEWGLHLDAQVEELRHGGSIVEVIGPDAAALAAFGVDGMDPALRPAAARAGFAHGQSLAPTLADFWR